MLWHGQTYNIPSEIRHPYNILVKKPEGRHHLVDVGADENKIFKSILKRAIRYGGYRCFVQSLLHFVH
jgi:hypothetical protein